jgi:serine phosphatase RsbU (regulator of sigma subunit)
VRDATGGMREFEEPGYLPLGLLGDEDLVAGDIRLAPTDALVLTSDGVWERRTRDRGFFGAAGVECALRNGGTTSATDIATNLITAVMAAADVPPTDDATVLVLTPADPR